MKRLNIHTIPFAARLSDQGDRHPFNIIPARPKNLLSKFIVGRKSACCLFDRREVNGLNVQSEF